MKTPDNARVGLLSFIKKQINFLSNKQIKNFNSFVKQIECILEEFLKNETQTATKQCKFVYAIQSYSFPYVWTFLTPFS